LDVTVADGNAVSFGVASLLYSESKA